MARRAPAITGLVEQRTGSGCRWRHLHAGEAAAEGFRGTAVQPPRGPPGAGGPDLPTAGV